jgi:hypothetical protein
MGVSPHVNSSFRQQKLAGCRPFLNHISTAIMYAILSIFGFAAGGIYRITTKNLLLQELPYGNNHNTSLQFQLNQTYHGPFYIYYRIDGFYQNHFLYSESKNWAQLHGKPYEKKNELDTCKPQVRDSKGDFYVPCGAVSRSLFNDTFHFSGNFPRVYETGISIPEFSRIFRAPDPIYKSDDNWLSNNSQFPGGQTNEHFINWERIAAFSTFPKLWGRTDKDAQLVAGELYTISVDANFPVSSFGGNKTLIIEQTMWLGGRNAFISTFLFSIGGIALLGTAVFLVAGCLMRVRDPDLSDDESMRVRRPLIE